MRMYRLCAISSALLLSSCAGSLQTTPNLLRTDRLSAALPGATYALPRLQYDLFVTRYLSSCPGEIGREGKPTRLGFAVEVKAPASYQPGESYAVDFSKLGGIARTGSFAIEWHDNGTLKAIGVKGEDQTGAIIQDLAKTALSVWSAAGVGSVTELGYASNIRITGNLASTLAAPVVEQPTPVTHITCSPTGLAAVRALKSQLHLLEEAKNEADEIRKATEAASSRASLKLLTRRDRERLSRQFVRLDQLDGAVRSITDSLGNLKKGLGVETKKKWSGDYSKAVRDQRVALGVEQDDVVRLSALLAESSAPLPSEASKADLKARQQTPHCYGGSATVTTCLADQLELKTNFATDEPIDRYCDEGETLNCLRTIQSSSKGYQDGADNVADRGVFVRDPTIGRLLVCRGFAKVCDLDSDQAGLEPSFIPQFGQLRFIPFVIRPFEGRTLNVDVAKDGRVTKLVYSTDKAMLAQIAAAAANVSGQGEAGVEKREARRRTDEDYSYKKTVQKEQDEIDRLTRQIALKDVQAKLNDPQGAVIIEIAELESQRSLAEARRARLEAEQKLEALLSASE